MKNEYKKSIRRISVAVSMTALAVFIAAAFHYYSIHHSQGADANVETVNVNDRSFDTITMCQYDRMVDYVYRFAGDDDFAVQYAVAECILNDIEKSYSQNKIDTYLDCLYSRRSDHFTQTKFENESEDKQDAIREAVQSALDERTMPSGVTAAVYKTDDDSFRVDCDEIYTQPYLSNTNIIFYYQ